MSANNAEETTASHLYCHIPFCPVKCDYCAFVTHIGSLKLAEPYVDALCTEADMRASRHDGTPLETIYLGGGTPSLLTPSQIKRILRHLASRFGVTDGCEITMESHPSTVTQRSLQEYRAAGVTRISFGGESLDSGELRALGRRHTGEGVLGAANAAWRAGFGEVALDFMYGIPQQTPASWRRTLERALDARVSHLSLYPLSIEPRTVFARRDRRHQLTLPDDETVVEMYELACTLLSTAGYEHYEVANWARPGFQCKHNTAYWRNREFYAIGAGAHGYLQGERTENVRHTSRYIDTVARGNDPIESREPIDAAVLGSETMMLGLRLLLDGPDLQRASRELGHHPFDLFGDDIADLTKSGLLHVDGERMTLDERAVPIANEIWQRFVAL